MPVGTLKIVKFIDADEDGIDDGVADPAGEGFTFTVRGPAPSTDVVCTGSTNASGELLCPNLAAGTYEITETQKNGFTNTTSLVVTTGVVSGQTTTETFGNRCEITKVFQVHGRSGQVRPACSRATRSLRARARASTPITLPLVDSRRRRLERNGADPFSVNNSITWSYGINLGLPTRHRLLVGSESFAGAGYPTCTKTNTTTFDAHHHQRHQVQGRERRWHQAGR